MEFGTPKIQHEHCLSKHNNWLLFDILLKILMKSAHNIGANKVKDIKNDKFYFYFNNKYLFSSLSSELLTWNRLFNS